MSWSHSTGRRDLSLSPSSTEGSQAFETPGEIVQSPPVLHAHIQPPKFSLDLTADDEELDSTVIAAPPLLTVSAAAPLLSPGWPPGSADRPSSMSSQQKTNIATTVSRPPGRPGLRKDGVDLEALAAMNNRVKAAHERRTSEKNKLERLLDSVTQHCQLLVDRQTRDSYSNLKTQTKALDDQYPVLAQADQSYLTEAEQHNSLANPDWTAERAQREMDAEAEWLQPVYRTYEKVAKKAENLLQQHRDLDVSDDDPDDSEDPPGTEGGGGTDRSGADASAPGSSGDTGNQASSSSAPGAGGPRGGAGGGGGGGGGGDDDDDDDDDHWRRPPGGGGGGGGRRHNRRDGDAGMPLEELVARLLTAMASREEASREEGRTATDRLAAALAEASRESAELQKRTVEILRNPRMDCPNFSGDDREDFAIWRTAFEQVYPASMLARERFLGIQAKTTGPARELLAGLSACDDSYPEAMARLYDKYGRPAQVIARLNRNFKSEATVTKTDDPVKLRSICEKIKTMVFSYSQLNEPLSGSYMIEAWLEKLPRSIARAWAKATLDDVRVIEPVLDAAGNIISPGNGMTKKGGNVDEFIRMLDDQVRLAESLYSLTKTSREREAAEKKKREEDKEKEKAKKQQQQHSGNSASLLAVPDGASKSKKSGKKKNSSNNSKGGGGGAPAPAADGGGAKPAASGQPQQQQRANITCSSCLNNYPGHFMAVCADFLKQPVPERRRWMWSTKRCKRCLLKGHLSDKCNKPVACTVQGCKAPLTHHPAIHYE